MTQNNQQWEKSFGYGTIGLIPDDVKGRYGFWPQNTGRCLYIGGNDSIKNILYQHWTNCHNPSLKSWLNYAQEENENLIKICYLEVKHSNIAKMESRLIKKWQPPLIYKTNKVIKTTNNKKKMKQYPAMCSELSSTEYFTTVIKARDLAQNTKIQSPDNWSNITLHEIYQIGNLTLLPPQYNKSKIEHHVSFVANKKIHEKSSILLTKKLCEHSKRDNISIEKRQSKLATLTAQVWNFEID